MNEEIKQKWLDALASGKYTQGSGSLRYYNEDKQSDCHCVLGVLADIYTKETGKDWESVENHDGMHILPDSVIDWAEFEGDADIVDEEIFGDNMPHCLWELNDSKYGWDFNRLSEFIKTRY